MPAAGKLSLARGQVPGAGGRPMRAQEVCETRLMNRRSRGRLGPYGRGRATCAAAKPAHDVTSHGARMVR